MNHEMQLLSIG